MTLHETEPRWFAVKTRHKCEKAVHRLLLKKQVAAYVPLQKYSRRYERKIRTVQQPLIPCYVFVCIVKAELIKVLQTEHVSDILRHNGQAQAIPEQEIQILRRVTLEEGIEVSGSRGPIHPGDHIEIVAGHLTGLRGVVCARDNRQFLQVELHTLGYHLSISLNEHYVQKVSPA